MDKGELINERLITPREVADVMGCNLEMGRREHAYIRKELGKGSKDLLLSQFCSLMGYDFWEILDYLTPRQSEVSYFYCDE